MSDVTRGTGLHAGGTGLHAGQPVAASGVSLGKARGALVVVHGRGGNAAEMLSLAELLAPPQTACLAPQAKDHVWYPRRFMEPVAHNEPDLGSALAVIGALVDRAISSGLQPEQVALLGISQGACLVLEFARRRSPRRLGAVVGFSGGLIGDTVTMPTSGSRPLAGMPVLLGCSDHDPHIPIARVRETDAAMRALGAEVTFRVYPGSTHEINGDEIALARQMLARTIGATVEPPERP